MVVTFIPLHENDCNTQTACTPGSAHLDKIIILRNQRALDGRSLFTVNNVSVSTPTRDFSATDKKVANDDDCQGNQWCMGYTDHRVG